MNAAAPDGTPPRRINPGLAIVKILKSFHHAMPDLRQQQ